jgi:hypothetical protein
MNVAKSEGVSESVRVRAQARSMMCDDNLVQSRARTLVCLQMYLRVCI